MSLFCWSTPFTLTSRGTHLRIWPHLHASGSRPKEQIESAMFEPALLIVQVPKMMEDYLRAVGVTGGRERRRTKRAIDSTSAAHRKLRHPSACGVAFASARHQKRASQGRSCTPLRAFFFFFCRLNLEPSVGHTVKQSDVEAAIAADRRQTLGRRR